MHDRPGVRSSGRLAALPAVILVAVALWEIAAARADLDVPGDPEWEAAAQVVRSGYKPGDLIVFAPRWADPIGRLHLGDLIPLETAARMDAARFGRIWELSMRGAHAPEVAGLSPVEEKDGPVTVRRFERPPAIVLVDLASAARTADRPVRVELTEVGFEPHRCVLVPTPPIRPYLDPLIDKLQQLPAPQIAKTLRAFDRLVPELPQLRGRSHADRTGTRIVFRQLPLGRELVGYVGIADVFTRREDRAPVTLAVDAGGATTEVTAPIDRWVRFSVATTPGVADIAVTLRWEAKPGELWAPKQVCFTAEARQ